jgi:hypothetical protein
MTKALLALAAGAALFVFALPGPADAGERRADGIRNSVEQTEFSSRHRRWHRHRHFVRRGYYRPYYGHPYAYGWGHPYYYGHRPFIGVGVGPFGFGVW